VTGEAVGCFFLTCFAIDTQVQVISNGIPTLVNVESLNPGDQVLTLESGLATYTEVQWVKKTEADRMKREGGFDFVELEVEGGALEVTTDHGVLVGPELKLKLAGAVGVGEELPVVSEEVWRANSSRQLSQQAKGQGLGLDPGVKRMKRVKGVRAVQHQEKVTVATQHGSIVANGVLVSTLCGEAFKEGESLEAAVPAWREYHKIPVPGTGTAKTE
jgi:hypothetical protein